jgi:hypothetical protein
MRWLLLAAALLALAGAACDAGSGAGAGPNPDGGRLLVQRVAKRTTTLLDGPGRAGYCAADSVLLVVAIGRNWTTGFAVRVILPLLEARTFQVQRSLGGPGTATAVFRPLVTGAAQVATGGTLRLETSRTINGHFEMAASESGPGHVSFRGRWSRLPLYPLPKGLCSPA